jgi:hypothetical protein
VPETGKALCAILHINQVDKFYPLIILRSIQRYNDKSRVILKLKYMSLTRSAC